MYYNRTHKEINPKFKIFDDIYGLIYFYDTERRLIDTPLFQRLRRIKQLGLAYLVFPGAVHTRFSHSIGTLAVAQKVAETLKLSKNDAKKLRLAALLHDIGHFPLSHTIESVYDEARERTTVTKLSTKIAKPQKSIALNRRDVLSKERVELHEEMSKKIIIETPYNGGITQILTQSGYNPFEIANIVTGSHENIILSQLMHSDIDIDKMDYLLRDSKNAGIMYGTCDVDYLISCMVKKKLIFYELKALKAIEHFLLARYFYFTQILYHKTRSVIEYMAATIYKKAMDIDLEIENRVVYKASNLDRLYKTRNLIHFDDTYFDNIVKGIRRVVKDKIVRRYATALIERNPPKLVSESMKMVIKPKDKDEIRKQATFDKDFKENKKKKEIRIIEQFDILKNYAEIKKSENLGEGKKQLLYGHRSAIRLDIPSTYKPRSEPVFLCQFPDTMLHQLANHKFKIYRIYKF